MQAPPAKTPSPPPEVRANMRQSLLAGAIAFLVLLVPSALMLFTSALSGDVGGVGIGYLIGFADFVLVLAAAAVYCARQDRAERAGGEEGAAAARVER